MTAARSLLDHYIVEEMDDIDLDAVERRMDLLLSIAPGTVNSGTEGVQGGHNVRSSETGLSGMVFHHSHSISSYLHSSIGTRATLGISMPADDETRAALLEGRPGIEMLVSRWRTAVGGAGRCVHGDEPLKAAERLVATVVRHANPEFPWFREVEIVLPTWATPADLRMEGKSIVTAAGERALNAALPRVVEISRDKGQTCMFAHRRKFRLPEVHDTLDMMRAIGASGIDLSQQTLRKAGLQAHL